MSRPEEAKARPAPEGTPPRGRADRLAAELRAAILRGRYEPGDRLPAERELATRHAVNRNSVREALKKLEQQGLVAIRPGGGARVNPLHLASVDLIGELLHADGELDAALAMQILDVTEILVAGAARLALERASESELLEARSLLRELDGSGEEIEPRLLAVDGLLELITRASDNLLLRMIYNAIRPTIQGEVGRLLSSAMAALHGELHEAVQEIERAVQERDPDALEVAVRRLQRAERRHLFEILSQAAGESAP